MKKMITMLLTLMIAGLFATDWYPASEGRIKNTVEPNLSSKDTTFYYYCGASYDWYSGVKERATYVNVEDFGLTYPVNFGGVQSYLYQADKVSSYKIYAKDGVTELWDSSDFTTSIVGWETIVPTETIILNDDFYIAHIPDAEGFPNIVYDDGSGVYGHSKLGYPGAWGSIGSLNWRMRIGLEQYTGADISGPSIRTMYGGDAFMGYDANITLAVTDEGTISAITGSYTIDGGPATPVVMSATKADKFLFTGTIPAQVDGTVGEVIFTVTDNLAHETVSLPYALSWSADNSFLYEDFERDFLPPGWTSSYAGAGFIKLYDDNPNVQQVHSGYSSAGHLGDVGAQDDYMITPVISIPASNSSTLEFWQGGRWYEYYGWQEVLITIDGGGSWNSLYYADYPISDGTSIPANRVYDGVWEKITLPLVGYEGQDVQIAFYYWGDESHEWFIDDVNVFYDYQAPEVVDLVGNEALLPVVGAYLNNDMLLTLTAYDQTGIQSIMGYYSFDEGTTIDSLTFANAKSGEEVWTATIPQQAAVDSGYINFKMVDTSGNTTVTMDYDIDFALDTDGPVFNYVKGTMAFVGDPMNLEISFSDESAISSCTGYYSIDGIAAYTSFAMDPSKIHDYSYVGVIPAEGAEVLDGKVYFGMKDAEGNVSNSEIITVKWMAGQNLEVEDFEFGPGNWTLTGNWAIVSEVGGYTSASNALTESPGGDYVPGEVSSAQWATPMDFTLNPGIDVSFWTKFDLEEGFDYMYFEGSGDGGTTWVRLATYNGEGVDWHQEIVPMNAFAGIDNVTFRFLFESDGEFGGDSAYEVNGMYIDDLIVTTYDVDHGAPTIISDPYAPLFYEGVVGAYTDAIEVVDYAGLNSVEIRYSVDTVVQTPLSATNTTGDFYEFTIPAQAPGSQVDYTIYAQDGSPQANEGTSKVYSYIAGDHMIYDEGIVSFYTTIENNAAKAVRVTVPGSDESKTIMTGKLSYILFRSYADGTHISATMQVHVWEDNAGLPGAELVTAFDVESEATTSNTSAMTRVDMTSYDLTVSGDFWIGYSAPYGIVYLTRESTDPAHASQTEIGSTAFGRSYTGTWNAGTSEWSWGLNALDNWHFRAVLDGVYSGIEDETVPMVTELEQNYPNPFNPATTINFSLAKDSKVSLVVYDVMGREVANLVNKNMASGSHKVSFDASRLVSGVYYYTLKAGAVNQTKKMMLIK